MTDWLMVAAGLVLLVAGAEGLVRGSVALALRMGLSPLVIGLTIVAFGTSSPELLVSVQASWKDQGAIALGNVIGSNIANIGLIMGLSACLCPLTVQAGVIRKEIPVMLGLTALLIGMTLLGRVGRIEGGVLLLFLTGYTIFAIRAARSETAARVEKEYEASTNGRSAKGPWLLNCLMLVGGLGVLAGGAELMVRGATRIALDWGISESVIGLTIVAVGTSLPELATTLAAAAKKETDVAVGNLVGSCIFNIAGILGGAAVIRPVSATGFSLVDLGVLAALSLATLPIMRSGAIISRKEGLLLLATYAGYIGWLVKQSMQDA